MPTVNRTTPKENHTQSVVLEKEFYTEQEAKNWVKAHDYFVDGFDNTETQYRFRQYNPSNDFNYRVKVIERSGDKTKIFLVLAIKK